MCGIAGYIGNKPSELIQEMTEKIAHRGPDNADVVVLEEDQYRVAFGHTRLSIIDLSPASNQPLWDDSKRYCIVFNGEIYNYLELKEKLVADGVVFHSGGDAEVLLNLFIAKREKAFEELNGIFAFAIWDSVEKECWVAKDHLGVKPLYYAENETGVSFSSELKSLLHDRTISRELDHKAFRQYIQYWYCPGARTPLLKVKKLQPGEYLRIREGKIVKKVKYYKLPRGHHKFSSYDESFSALESSLRNSIERQLVSDAPVGAFLSGGLDSSSVAYFATQKIGGANLPCYTISFQTEKTSGFAEDLPYAVDVAKHLGVPLHIINIKADIINDFPNLIYQLDEPHPDPAPMNAYYISKMAREMGIKVLLSGAGGDDILTGYRRHFAIQQEKYWSDIPHAGRVLLQRGTSRLPKGNPLLRRVAKAFQYADKTPSERIMGYYWWLEPSLLDDLFVQPTRGGDALIDYFEEMEQEDLTSLQKMLLCDTRFFLPDLNFNYTDKVSMAHGVEVRVPLVDLEMMETAARIPDRFKQKGKHGKWIFKKVMEGKLPEHVIYRPKTGFGAPLRGWLHNDLRPLMDELLSRSVIESRGILSYDAVKELRKADEENRMDAAYPLFAMMSMELWCRQFVDVPVPEARS